MNFKRFTRARRGGFSLATVSILLTVAAVVMVAAIPGRDASDTSMKIITNKQHLERVEEAMRSFMAVNGRRPCPASGQYAEGDANFGKEAATPGTCTGGTPAATLGPDNGTNNIVGGTIPTKALSLPDEYAFDEFGHRITYVVDKRATLNSTCLSTTTGGIKIESSTNGTVLDNVMYAYISHGTSGHGAFPYNGSTAANRINSGSTDQDMNTNAGASNDGNMTYSTSNFKNYFVQKAKTSTFDDVLWYRPDLKNTCCVGKTMCQSGCTQPWGGNLANGNSVTAYVATNDTTCTAHTLTCTNNSLTCDGSGTLTNCQSSTCARTCSLNANQGGGTLNGVNPGNTATEYPNNTVTSPATCTPYTLTCTGNTSSSSLSCSTGGADLTDCKYSSCVQVPPGCDTTVLTSFSPPSMNSGDSLPAYASGSDTSCTGHTLTCNSGTLKCDGSATLTNCEYSSCALACSPNAGQGGGTLTSGSTRTEYQSNSSATCTAETMTCTSGSLSCSVGNMSTDCQSSTCYRTCAPNANQGGGTLAGNVAAGSTTRTEYISTSDSVCTAYTLTCTGNSSSSSLSCSTGGADLTDCAYSTCAKTCSTSGLGAGFSPNPMTSGQSVNAYVASSGASCTAHTLTCTNGSLTCDGSGTLTNCNYSSCTVSSNGSVSNGVTNGDAAGWSVASGDVNGDGYADLIIGAYNANAAAGKVYVVFGSSTGIANPLALSALNGSNGFELDGAAGSTGWSVAAGDVNGDGKADIIIGAPLSTVGATSNAGKVFVVFGGATKAGNGAGTAWTSCPCTLNAAYLNGTNGAEFDGPTTNGGHAGNSVAVGDVNGDGKADILIGANRATIGANASAGAVYLVFGKAGAWSGTATSLAAAFLNGTNGAEFDGYATGDQAGYSLAAGNVKGSVNGANPISDIIIGEAVHSSNLGMVTVVFGKTAGWSGTAQLLSSSCSGHGCTAFLDGTNGVEFDGGTASSLTGYSVAAGDVNGDGKADILIGAPNVASSAGAVYVIFGKAAGWSGTATAINAAFLNGTNGAEFDGGAANYGAGDSLAAADVNHDGKADILIGEGGISTNTGGAAVVFGKAAGSWSGTATTLNAAFLNGTNGIQLNGANTNDDTCNSYTGIAGGDINGDSSADIIMGAWQAPDSGSAGPGKVYIYNGKSAGWTTPVALGGL